jgi:hypothetical protein
MKLGLSTLLFFILSCQVFAIFCPYCGTENDDDFKYCFECGHAIHKLKNKKKSPKVRTIRLGGVKTQSHQTNNSGAQSLNGFSLGNNKAQFGASMNQLMGMGSVQQLLKLQGQNIDEDKLQELNNNPQVNQLMNMMKNPAFQKQIMQGLQMFGKPGNKKKTNQQLNQLNGLFKMLNQQSTINQSTP